MQKTIRVKTVLKTDTPGIQMPSYKTDGASGMDIAADEHTVIMPGKRTAVRTGLFLEIPPGFEAQVRPRSGLALNKGITVLNSPGTIDSDYRGEVMVILINLGDEPFSVSPGDRIAQLVFAETAKAALVRENTVSVTARGSGGFGSTGIKQEELI